MFKSFVYIICSSLLLVSCDYITDLNRTGDEITIEIDWDGSNQIEVNASSNIVLINSNEHKIKITGMDFIAKDYQMDTVGNKLNIKHSNPYRLQKDKLPEILIYAPIFSRLTINAPAQITNRDSLQFTNFTMVVNGRGTYSSSKLLLNGQNFRLNVHGRGTKTTHHLSGKVQNAQYHIEGGTQLDGVELLTETTSVRHMSFSNIYIYPKRTLDVTIFSSGNVFYEGSPEIKMTRDENTLLRPTGNVFPIKQ